LKPSTKVQVVMSCVFKASDYIRSLGLNA
jgi:hypothetical protein